MRLPITDARLRHALWAFLALVCLGLGVSYQIQMLALPHFGHLLLPYDGDNWRRLTIVREWLAGGSFFDHTIPRVNAPFGGIETHWTRFLDILLAGITHIAPASYTLNQKLMFAAGWYPLIIALAALACLNRAASRTSSAQHLLCLAALALFNSVPGDYFAPGDADHHGTLCALWCGVLALMARSPGPRAAIGIGILLGCMTWISVEGILLAALVYTVLGARALLKPETADSLVLATAAAAVVAAAALLIQQPHDALTHVVYDSISIVHVLLLSLCAAGTLALRCVLPRLPTLPQRLTAAAAVAGAGVMAVMAATFPKFFHGPRVDMDAFVAAKFLPSIMEARSLFILPWQTAFAALWLPALAAALLAATWDANLWRRDRWRQASLAALLVLTFLPLLMEIRWNYYLQPVAGVIVAMLLPHWIMAARTPLRLMPRRHRPWIALWILLFSVSAFTRLTGQESFNAVQECSLSEEYALQNGLVQERLGDSPLVLLADANVAGVAQFFTPYAVIAGNYDREAQGLKDLSEIYGAETAEEARPLLEQRAVGALLACPSVYPKESWISRLPGKGAPWLKSLGVLKLPFKTRAELLLFEVRPYAAGTKSKRPSGAG
jgi:hypothetical protein